MAERCDNCGILIQDTDTIVEHGGLTFCCANCSNAMEQQGSGSDPSAGRRENDLFCVHCGSPISDESTLRSLGDDAYCCSNCFLMAA